MSKYLLKRLLLAIPTLLGASLLVFGLLRAVPGDVCELRLGGTGQYVDEEQLVICRNRLGLNDSYPVQYWDFISGYASWDLGESMWTGQPVTYEIGLRFQLSLEIALVATFFAVIIAIPLGIISAVKQNTWIDYVVRIFAVAGIAMPSFWLGILIILGLLISTSHFLGTPWMPPIEYTSPFDDFGDNFAQVIFPALATGYRYSAVAMRMTRSALLEVLREDYVRTARAKGMYESVVVNHHALKNALLPVVTIIALEFAFLMGGLVVTEQVFNLNGLGKLFVDSVLNNDYIMTQNLVMLVVVIFVATNLTVDLFYAWLDPRIRYS
jgi:peptide/nickel transport system permease protein